MTDTSDYALIALFQGPLRSLRFIPSHIAITGDYCHTCAMENKSKIVKRPFASYAPLFRQTTKISLSRSAVDLGRSLGKQGHAVKTDVQGMCNHTMKPI